MSLPIAHSCLFAAAAALLPAVAGGGGGDGHREKDKARKGGRKETRGPVRGYG